MRLDKKFFIFLSIQYIKTLFTEENTHWQSDEESEAKAAGFAKGS